MSDEKQKPTWWPLVWLVLIGLFLIGGICFQLFYTGYTGQRGGAYMRDVYGDPEDDWD